MTEQEVLAQVRSLYLRLLSLGTYQQQRPLTGGRVVRARTDLGNAQRRAVLGDRTPLPCHRCYQFACCITVSRCWKGGSPLLALEYMQDL